MQAQCIYNYIIWTRCGVSVLFYTVFLYNSLSILLIINVHLRSRKSAYLMKQKYPAFLRA